MQNEHVKLVNLKPSHPEYGTVEKMFKKTCPNFNIEKVISYGVGRGGNVNAWARNINILSKYLLIGCLQPNTPFVCQCPPRCTGWI